MSCILYSFEESMKWTKIFVHFCQFRAFKRLKSNFHGVHCLWPLNLHIIWKNQISSLSDDRDTKHYVLKWTFNVSKWTMSANRLINIFIVQNLVQCMGNRHRMINLTTKFSTRKTIFFSWKVKVGKVVTFHRSLTTCSHCIKWMWRF